MGHTPEPWSKLNTTAGAVIIHHIMDGLRRPLCHFEGNLSGAQKEANRDRIIVCVNACKGLPNDLLEKVAAGDGAMAVRVWKRDRKGD